DGRAAEVRAGPVAAVVAERRVDDLEPAAADEDRAAAPAFVRLAGGVPVGEGEVLDDQAWRGLVVAVVGGPGLLRVAVVLVEDPPLAAAAQGDQPAAVDDHALAGVDHLGRLLHLDRDRVGTAAEPDDAALGHRAHDGPGGAARRRAVAHPAVGVGRVDRPRLLRDGDRLSGRG